MEEITFQRPEGLVNSRAFSHLVVIPPSATTIHVGGQNAVNAEGALIGGGDIAAQVRQVMGNLETALAAAGATLADLVSWSILLVEGVDSWTAYSVAASALDPERDPPIVTVARVAGLAVEGALVEVSATAAVLR